MNNNEKKYKEVPEHVALPESIVTRTIQHFFAKNKMNAYYPVPK
eukprot:gene11842-3505_t